MDSIAPNMSEAKITVVVVEDEANIRRFIKLALEHEGLVVHEAGTVQRGLIETATRHANLVILDLGLPDQDGMDFIRDLRTWSDIPILVLSARTTETDKVIALDGGADDYLTKPFGVAELLARVRAHLRRQLCNNDGNTVVEFGSIKVDLMRRTVQRQGEPLHLTPIEYRLLTYLVNNPDKVLTHRQLLKDVWGPSHVNSSHYVRIYMGQLRKKIEHDPSRPRHIVTEVGMGYRFVISP